MVIFAILVNQNTGSTWAIWHGFCQTFALSMSGTWWSFNKDHLNELNTLF